MSNPKDSARDASNARDADGERVFCNSPLQKGKFTDDAKQWSYREFNLSKMRDKPNKEPSTLSILNENKPLTILHEKPLSILHEK